MTRLYVLASQLVVNLPSFVSGFSSWFPDLFSYISVCNICVPLFMFFCFTWTYHNPVCLCLHCLFHVVSYWRINVLLSLLSLSLKTSEDIKCIVQRRRWKAEWTNETHSVSLMQPGSVLWQQIAEVNKYVQMIGSNACRVALAWTRQR